MSNFNYEVEYISNEEIRITEKQAKCHCTYLKCPKCGKSKDNLFQEQKEINKVLVKIIKFYEDVLMDYGISTIPIDYLIEFNILDSLAKKRKTAYESQKKNGRIETGRFL